MKIYEYARGRNIKSKDVVKKLHELGFTHIKNHLSLVPEKIIDTLDDIEFDPKNKINTKPSKNVAIVTMECAPFISKGLGDMVGNKIQYSNLNGNDVKVVLPKYKINLEGLTFVKDIEVEVYHQKRKGKVYQYELNHVMYYFIEDNFYFNRDELYGYYDDAERFAFLTKASIEVIKSIDVKFDIINIHDWPLGLFPLVYKETEGEAVVEFSVYGSTYQGLYGIEVLTDVYGLNEKYFKDKTVEHANSVNLLKSGLVTADKHDINKVALNDLKNSYLKQYVYDNM